MLNAALQDKEVSKYRMVREQIDPIAWLQENLKVEFIAGSEVMEISLSGDDPHELAGIVNAVKKAYMEEVVNVDTKQRTDRHDQLKKIKETVRRNPQGAAGQPEEACRNGRVGRPPDAGAQATICDGTPGVHQEGAPGVQSQKRKAEAQLKTQRPEESPRGDVGPVGHRGRHRRVDRSGSDHRQPDRQARSMRKSD